MDLKTPGILYQKVIIYTVFGNDEIKTTILKTYRHRFILCFKISRLEMRQSET